jgi:hypothetical protein
MGFWDGFNAGYGAVSQIRERNLLSNLARNPGDTSARNKLMALDPQLMMQQQAQQRQQQQFDNQQTLFQQGQDDRQARQGYGQMVASGDLQGAQNAALSNGDTEFATTIDQMIARGDAHAVQQFKNEAQVGAAFYDALSQVPEKDRAAWVQQNAEALKQNGVPVEMLDPSHLSDAFVQFGLAKFVGADKAIDNRLAAAKEKEQAAYHQAQIGVSQQRVDNQKYGLTHAKPRAGGGSGKGGAHDLPAGFSVIP